MKCIIVGARESLAYSRKLRYLAGKLSEDRRHRFIVVPETGETAVYWRAADVFCCTSRLESYPRVTLEAMAAGLPLISTPVYGLAEQVRHSVNGLTYHPGDIKTLAKHLAVLAEDQEQRQKLADASTWVLRGLPDHSRMDEQYWRTFQAAAESSVAPVAWPGESTADIADRTPSRIWWTGPARPITGTHGTSVLVSDGKKVGQARESMRSPTGAR
jgi:glycosyltransferase involved in cell wall biosynthesis